nr:outer membrane beta-barrel protein [Jiulongibacter sediminis]
MGVRGLLQHQLSDHNKSQFNLSYLSKRNKAQGEVSRFYQPNISIKKGFLDNRLSASLLWQNISF